MTIQLTNVSEEQRSALAANFGAMETKPAEQDGKFDVTIDINTEIDAWKLFFSGADYCLAKIGRVKL